MWNFSGRGWGLLTFGGAISRSQNGFNIIKLIIKSPAFCTFFFTQVIVKVQFKLMQLSHLNHYLYLIKQQSLHECLAHFNTLWKQCSLFWGGSWPEIPIYHQLGIKRALSLKKASKLTNFLQVLTKKGGDFLLSDTCTQKTYSLNLQKPEWNSNHSELTDDILVWFANINPLTLWAVCTYGDFLLRATW